MDGASAATSRPVADVFVVTSAPECVAWLAEQRAALGWSLRRHAAEASLSPATVSNLGRRNNPSVWTVALLAAASGWRLEIRPQSGRVTGRPFTPVLTSRELARWSFRQIGATMLVLREQSGRTRAAVADQAGIHEMTLYRMEYGYGRHSREGLDTLLAVATVLDQRVTLERVGQP